MVQIKLFAAFILATVAITPIAALPTGSGPSSPPHDLSHGDPTGNHGHVDPNHHHDGGHVDPTGNHHDGHGHDSANSDGSKPPSP